MKRPHWFLNIAVIVIFGELQAWWKLHPTKMVNCY